MLGSFVVMKNSIFKTDFVPFKFLGFNIKESSRRQVCSLIHLALVYTEHLTHVCVPVHINFHIYGSSLIIY